jgi:hypothetical protein
MYVNVLRQYNYQLPTTPNQGTGSYPPGLKGWHRRIRLTVSHKPFKKPCLKNASAEYSEQLGVKRQAGGSMGDIHRL